jgi:Na+/H+ antiporter NhaD/arsenite permease-like protein
MDKNRVEKYRKFTLYGMGLFCVVAAFLGIQLTVVIIIPLIVGLLDELIIKPKLNPRERDIDE